MKRIIDKIAPPQENNLPSEIYVQALIRAARSSQTQKKFSEQLCTSQNLLSKYESGAIKNPPANIIGECLKIILQEHNSRKINLITSSDLASHIIETLSGDEQANIRKLIYDLVSELSNKS